MAKKFTTYENAKAFVKDKDLVINSFIKQTLDKTQQIFKYENLPETIPESELEYILQTKGHAIFAKHNDSLYVFNGSFSGEPDVYNRAKEYIVANTALKLTKTFKLNEDSILIRNDFNHIGLLPTIQKYGVLLLDSELSLNVTAILSRLSLFISASDDKTKASAEIFLKKILDGEVSVIGENALFEGVRLQTSSTSSSNMIQQLIELIQYYKASFLNEIGLQANYNMKRERLGSDEVGMNVDALLPFIDNMFKERKQAIEKVNEMFETDISIDYNSAWKNTHEHAEKELNIVNTEIIEGEEVETTEELSDKSNDDNNEESDSKPSEDDKPEDKEDDSEEQEETEEQEEQEEQEEKKDGEE